MFKTYWDIWYENCLQIFSAYWYCVPGTTFARIDFVCHWRRYYSSLSTIVWIVRHLIAPVIRYLHPVVHYIAVTGGQLDTKAFVSFFVTYNWFLIIQSLWHAWCMSVCSWTFSICLGQESRLISILWNNQHHKWKLEPLIFLQLYENVWYLYKAFHVWDHILNTIY